MSAITTIFWDVGGVLLSNGWGREARAAARARFDLASGEFEDRHQRVVLDFECGRLSIEDYLAAVVFHQPRAFSPDEFRAFMCQQSTPNPDMLELVATLARSERYLMAALNNESLALNRHRINTYHLDRLFTAFFSSCYLGVAKPDDTLFHKALQIAHRRPEECLFIDDRPPNVEAARRVGITAIHFTGHDALRRSLIDAGVTDVES